ncbi:MAG: DUF2470 domain-containing protein [Candidatus Rokubacteria bacterium]|nr:DUF2470 domain-containing protein [Candidatus Rokubacteria bacterium]
MNHHAAPEAAQLPPAPEPTYAESARTLVYLGRTGMLSTLSAKHPGHPFGSLMPYALDERGRPLFLMSTLAMHTQNLQVDRRASLFVIQPGWTGDPLAAGRVTLVGEVCRLPEADGPEVREAYLSRHPNAAYWIDFKDFGFYRLEVADVYYVGGFAAMDWVSVEEYLAARPDPLADAAAAIIEHMNRDHPDALVTFARVLAGASADAASLVSVDRLGFKLRIKSGQGLHSARIAFPREVTTAEESRAVFVEMVCAARQRVAP